MMLVPSADDTVMRLLLSVSFVLPVFAIYLLYAVFGPRHFERRQTKQEAIAIITAPLVGLTSVFILNLALFLGRWARNNEIPSSPSALMLIGFFFAILLGSLQGLYYYRKWTGQPRS
jgi:protein-S-isoprenylcysteine O-methyltransferase Ste14